MIVAKTRGRFASQSVQGKASHEYAQSGRRQRHSAQVSNKKRLGEPAARSAIVGFMSLRLAS